MMTDAVPAVSSSDDQCCVKVAVRVRPLTAKEQLQNCNDCVSYVPGRPEVVLDSTRGYTFDWVFSPSSTQTEVYEESVLPPIGKFLDGYNATILAYGQTGSGKTFTMGTGLEVSQDDPDTQGIVPRAIGEIFIRLQENTANNPGYKWEIYVSFLELYNEELIDLLNPPLTGGSRKVSSLTIREDGQGGIYWSGVKEEPASSPEDLINLLQKGSLCRTTGSTDMNLTSSRSHAIFSIILKQEIPPTGEDSLGQGTRKLHSKFNFVDLAGSERLKKTKAVGDRAKEGISINSGLLAMGKVIHALNDRASHVPYRDSKLTRLLQDSLGGNSQTLMIACVSPADSNFGETMNTLNYASRARNIRNRVMVNEDYQAMEVHQLRAEISRLKMELMAMKSISSGGNPVIQAPSRMGFRVDDLVDANVGKRLRSENDGLRAECRQLELQLYHVRERIKLLRQSIENYDMMGSLQINDPEVVAVIDRYRDAVVDLTGKLQDVEDELLPRKTIKSTSRHNPLPRSFSTLSVVNETIQRARREIQKEVKLVQRKRPDSPKLGGRKPSMDSLNMSTQQQLADIDQTSEKDLSFEDENEENNFKAEDEMLSMLEQIQTDISLKEELVEQLEKTQSEYSVMREKYEEKLRQLQGNLSLIQKERDKALKRSGAGESNDEKAQVAMIRSKYEDKITKLTGEISDLRRKYQEVQRKISDKRATNETLLRNMKGNIEALKTEKMKMIQRLRERDQHIREREQEHDREITKLRRRERQIQEHAKKLESSNQMQKLMLKRRTEEHLQAQNKLRSVMKMLKKTRPTSSPIGKRTWRNQSIHMDRPSSALHQDSLPSHSPQAPRHPLARQLFATELSVTSQREEDRLKMQASFKKNLIFHELNNYISGKQITEMLDDLVQKRAALSEDKRELAQEKSHLDSRLSSTPNSVANAELLQMLRQQSLDFQDRITIVDAEINYYSNRIRSMQVETIKGQTLPASGDSIDMNNGFENAIDMVKTLDGEEAKKMLESMIEDIISLKISDRALQVENQQLQEESNELRRSIAVMRKAALENTLENEMNASSLKRSSPAKQHHSPTQNRHHNNPDQSLLSEMESLERDFEQIGNDLKAFAAESNLTLPDRQQEPLRNLNVFERLHRVQTVASQAKVKDHHPLITSTLRSSKDGLTLDDRISQLSFMSGGLSTGSILASSQTLALPKDLPPQFKSISGDMLESEIVSVPAQGLDMDKTIQPEPPTSSAKNPSEFESTAAAATTTGNDSGMEKLISIRDAIQRAMFSSKRKEGENTE